MDNNNDNNNEEGFGPFANFEAYQEAVERARRQHQEFAQMYGDLPPATNMFGDDLHTNRLRAFLDWGPVGPLRDSPASPVEWDLASSDVSGRDQHRLLARAIASVVAEMPYEVDEPPRKKMHLAEDDEDESRPESPLIVVGFPPRDGEGCSADADKQQHETTTVRPEEPQL